MPAQAEFWASADVGRFVAAAQAVLPAAREGAVRGLGLGAQRILDVSNTQVPHEEGDLERDGGWSIDEAQLRAAVTYGRRADVAEYAVVQHEDMSLDHDPGRNAKFLENALNSERTAAAEIIAQAVRDSMGTGGAS